MRKKVFWMDTETSGLEPERYGLLTLAGLVEIDNEIKEEFIFKVKPFPTDLISEEALKINNINHEEIKAFNDPLELLLDLNILWNKYIDCYDKYDKFIVAGYNVGFDVAFLESFFRKIGNNYLYSYLSHKVIDILSLLRFLDYARILTFDSFKLSDVCNEFGMEIQAHDALSDIKATYEVAQKIKQGYYELYTKK